MAQLSFDLVYDGPGLSEGVMPVHELAPALTALSGLFAQASVIAHPDRDPVTLHVRGVHRGSFGLELLLDAPWSQVVEFFSSDEASALANVFQYVGGSYGLFRFIQDLKKRTIKEQRPADDAGDVVLTLSDGTQLVVPFPVLALYRNVEVRRRARIVVEPLEEDGIEVVRFTRDEVTTVAIRDPDLPAFESPPVVEEPVGTNVVDMQVSIASAAFVAGKWRLDDGNHTFYASIEDRAFRAKVESGLEAFRAGDSLRCTMEIVQSRSDGKLHTEYNVLRVLEHIRAGIQLRLPEDFEDHAA